MTAAETGRATSKAHLEQLGRDGCGLLCVTGTGLAGQRRHAGAFLQGQRHGEDRSAAERRMYGDYC